MKKTTLFLLLFTLTILAKEPIQIDLECSKQKSLSIIIHNKKLNLSEDAVIDNLGGYVDIPENSFYLKTSDKVYHIHGQVINLGYTHQFISEYKSDARFITLKELYSLKEKKNLKFIQKIHLEKDNRVVKNILDVYFDAKSFEREYQQCQEYLSH